VPTHRRAVDDILTAVAAAGGPATPTLRDDILPARAALLLALALLGSADLDQAELPELEEVEDQRFYQAALSAWRSLAVDAAPGLTWLGGPDGVLAFHRGNFSCTVNLSQDPVPVIGPVLLASAPILDGLLPPHAAVWTSGLPGADQAAQHTVHEGW
jgi:hypothetical protein